MASLTRFPNGIQSFFVGPVLGGYGSAFGNVWFVNTGASSNGNGKSPSQAFTTMEQALNAVGDNDTIYWQGRIREQLVAPLGVQGVSIIGAAGGANRNDDGAWWTYPASGAVAGQALLELREQGWMLSNFMMTPEPTGGACVKLHRAESATYPDASHAIIDNVRFTGAGDAVTGTPIGIEDVGGMHHVTIQNCEFQVLDYGIYGSSQAIATPLRNRVLGNLFRNNTNDIDLPSSYSLFEGNRHFKAATKTIDIAVGEYNMVTGNVWADVAADIDPGNGYDGNATDTWTGNLVQNQAAFVFGDPA